MYQDYIAVFLVGILVGAGLVRYGIGYGIKITARQESGKLFENLDKPIEQITTNEDEE